MATTIDTSSAGYQTANSGYNQIRAYVAPHIALIAQMERADQIRFLRKHGLLRKIISDSEKIHDMVQATKEAIL